MPFFTEKSLRRSLAGRDLGHDTRKILAESGADTGNKRVSFLAKNLRNKNERKRKEFYSETGFSLTGRKRIEKVIGKGPASYTKAEERKIKKEQEVRRKANVAISRRFFDNNSDIIGGNKFSGKLAKRRVNFEFMNRSKEPEAEQKGRFAGSAGASRNNSGSEKKDIKQSEANDIKKEKNNNKPFRPLGLGSL